jgi:hypothetical protein
MIFCTENILTETETSIMAVKDNDIATIGMAMYENMRAEMEANEWGRMVVIDVNSGDYEVADDDLSATMRLFERRPDAVTWGELVGYPAPCYIR